MTEPNHAYPYTAHVRVNGGKEEVRARVSDDHLLSARVKLRPGNNSLLVVLANKFRRHEEEVKVYCPQPPRILTFTAPKVGAKPLIDLTARVEATKGLPPLGARLNDHEVDSDDLTIAPTRDNPAVWTVHIKCVPLVAGKNSFTLTVRNDDGDSAPAVVVVSWDPPKAPEKAVVEIVEPRRAFPVTEPKYQLAFRVRSASKTEVRLLLNSKPLSAGKPSEADGAQVYKLTVTGLREGANTLEVMVDNDGGRTTAVAPVVSFTPSWAAEVFFDRLQRQDNDEYLPLTAKAPVGNVWLHGHVQWRVDKDPLLEGRVRMRIWVNDFEQFDALLGPARNGQRTFRASVRLNREQNRIQVGLPPDLKLKSNKPPAVEVACAHPEMGQRLHLVVLGPGQRDQKKLIASVLKAFLATDVKKNSFTTPAFDEGVLYGPLPSNVRRERVMPLLESIDMKLRRSRGPLNDVVVVFFSGKEVVRNKKHYLQLEESMRIGQEEKTALDCDEIRQILSRFRGAKLLLLDADCPDQSAERAGGAGFPHLGFYRYVWLGKDSAPEKARLVHALQESLLRAALVRDQGRYLANWARDLGKMASFELLCPPGLEQLRLGKPAK